MKAIFYFATLREGAKRVRGKRDRGAANKTPVFGMLKRDSKIYTQIVKNASAKSVLMVANTHNYEIF